MKCVWILRHAKSSWNRPGLVDHDRPLAPRGRRAGERIARWAEANRVLPDLVLCSSAVRARATLELVRPVLGRPAVVVDGGIYHATADDLVERLATVDDSVEVVMVVGHNPAMLELTALLAPPGPQAFPTGALAGIELGIERWEDVRPGCGRLDSFVLPRSLTG